MSDIEAVLKEASEQIAEGVKKAKDALKPGLRDFLKGHPRIKALRWNQYSPHFNDGEPCTFSVHELNAFFGKGAVPDGDCNTDEEDRYDDNGEEIPDKDGERWHAVSYPCDDVIKKEYKEELAALVKLEKLLGDNEDALEQLFGDGVQVTVTRKGVSVDDYSHD